MEDKIYFSGLTAGGLLQAMLICLKAANLTAWSWWMVLLPTWICLLLFSIILIVGAYVLYNAEPEEAPLPEEPKGENITPEQSTSSSTSEVPIEKMSKPVKSMPKSRKKATKEVEEVIPPVQETTKPGALNPAALNTVKEESNKVVEKSKEDSLKATKESKPKAKKPRKKKADGEDTKQAAKGNTDK